MPPFCTAVKGMFIDLWTPESRPGEARHTHTDLPSCRRRDGTIGIAIGAPPSPPLLSEYEAFTKRPALSRRKLHPAMSSHSIPTVLHEGDADMDPTEWKPDGTSSHPGGVGGSTRSTAPHTHVPRTHSEAHLYLSQFHRSSDSLGSSGGRRAKKDIKHLAGTAPGIGAVAGKGFSLTPGGSNESSVAGSPVESASASISGLTNGTAPSITFDPAHEDEVDGGKVMMVNGMGFSKQKVEARDDADGSLAKLLAASVVA